MKVSPKYFFNAWLGSGAGIFIFSIVVGKGAQSFIIGLTVLWLLFVPYIYSVVLPKARAVNEGKKK
jgi:hypothetical protein